MKYVIILADGMAGEPIKELHDRTTLEAAKTPMMDALAPKSEIGMACMVPEGMKPGSDTANLSVIGYDPHIYYTGRSPLEALSIGVNMSDDDVAFRANLVTLTEEEKFYEERTIIDHSSSEISTEDAAILIEDLKKELQKDGFSFYVGTSYRHLCIWKKGKVIELVPPHDILTRKIGEYLPKETIFVEMMKKSYEILSHHPLNKKRKENGLHPANSLWFWGAGTKPQLKSFKEKTGKEGVMVSAVDLLKGIAVGAGVRNIIVEGANGGLHTNYRGKAQAAIDALRQGADFAYVHIEAPDEMGHQGLAAEKIQSIEQIDKEIVTPIVQELGEWNDGYRILILPDHPTPIRARTHTKDPVPYLLYKSDREVDGETTYNEKTAKISGIYLKDGYRLIERLLGE